MDGLILTEEQLRKEVEYFLKQDAFCFDIESMNGVEPDTRGVPAHNRVVWIAMATHGRTIVIPLGHPNGDVLLQRAHRKKNKETGKFEEFPVIYDAPPKQLLPSVAFEILRPLFFSSLIKIAHNAVMDFVSVAKYFGEIPPGPVHDTIVTQWMLDENIGQVVGGPKRPIDKKLKTLTKWYYSVDYDKEGVGKCIEAHPFTKVARYAMLDAKYTWLLSRAFEERLSGEALEAHTALERSLTEVLFTMNLEGAPVDVQAIHELEVLLTKKLEEIETRVYRAAGKVFNINSPKQKQDILYGLKKDDGQELKPWSLTDTGKKKKNNGQTLDIYCYSTDKEVLESYPENAVCQVLLEYQEVAKLLGTYVLGYLGDPENSKKPCRIFYGRIHADLVQYGTVTSRFSCREPNLQNIPRPGTELGTAVRGLFRAPSGYKLVVADYAQIEYRVLAHYLGHGVLYDGFHAGVDAHKATASAMYKVLIEEVDKEMRQDSKALGFGILFGAMEKKIAATMNKSVQYAKDRIADYEATQPEVGEFKKAVWRAARSRKVPHVRTITGFVRRVWDLNSPERWQRLRAERQAFNSLIQGGAAGLIKMAMIRIHKTLQEDYAKHNDPVQKISLVLSVHDELVLLAPEHRAEEAKIMLEQAMTGEGMQILKVPLEADAKIVDRWSEAK
jgi:DNA polymerase I-like protein with 3'-5' exonuclease and polymerase domains